jgi:hypothetical protein
VGVNNSLMFELKSRREVFNFQPELDWRKRTRKRRLDVRCRGVRAQASKCNPVPAAREPVLRSTSCGWVTPPRQRGSVSQDHSSGASEATLRSGTAGDRPRGISRKWAVMSHASGRTMRMGAAG